MNKGLLFKILAMFLALGFVLWAIRSLNTYTSQPHAEDDSLALLLGTNAKPFNWCPESTILVEWYSQSDHRQRTFEKATEVARVCELMIEGFSSEGLDKPKYRRLLTATDSQGQEKILEKMVGHEVYRVDGMPFQAPMLKKVLERLDKMPAPTETGL